MSFDALGLINPLLQALKGLDHVTPTAVQAETIPAVLAGRDVLAAARTGTGKTAGFALPLLQRLSEAGPRGASNAARALVLVPTRELAEQVHLSFRGYGRHLPLRTVAAYGGVSINPQMMRLRGGVDVLVATPGRLLDLHGKNAVKFHALQTLVLDEADRMLDLGFARELEAIFALLPRRRQTLLFSATFSDAIRAMAADLLHEPLSLEVSPRNAIAENISQRVVVADKKRKPPLLIHLLKKARWPQALVFVKTRRGAEQLVAQMLHQGLKADAIHGDKPQPARLKALGRFKRGEVKVLVATDVAARGLDIPAMPVVYNLDLPIVAQDYVHRIGRTGRAGASGEAISLVSADEAKQLAAIEALVGQTLPRDAVTGYEPEHRVPVTGPAAARAKKPRKPKKPKKSSAEKKARKRKQARRAGGKPVHRTP
ncbi:DEAD/DEAH box helicase [Alkalilimnicola sp. S0819]|uniref:DEAD/DEAH box helicase n=1 Tax=Alkalilimnicola sp. S0819 TaxID=2613922 RepID=UPI001262079A|nr:DEAD/DEAH box helicase [Alkalilimnicola sp. S0819]KAB7624121.1 DEAD/DEAH box helicase [Alkalilimnicola sp. S0819]MPQ16373.1 DEAD/DEAH box helicase [Alkalilimnicola sp. S0819]